MHSELKTAFDHVRSSGFKLGPSWTAAHAIAQNHGGEHLFDALHALLHRIEGDTFNAGYWDRRAGTDLGAQGLEYEFQALVDLARTA